MLAENTLLCGVHESGQSGFLLVKDWTRNAHRRLTTCLPAVTLVHVTAVSKFDIDRLKSTECTLSSLCFDMPAPLLYRRAYF